MKKFDTELAVGIFIIAGVICLGYLSVKLGQMEIGKGDYYEIHALFSSSGGLKSGSSVRIAGVDVGRVKDVFLEDYQAKVVMSISLGIKVQEDAIASVKTKGLIGEKFIEITPGADDRTISPGGRIRETQPAVDIEQLVSNFVFGKI